MSSYQPEPAPPPPERYGAQQLVEAPPSIRTAVNIVWGIVAMSVVSLVLTFLYLDDIVEAAAAGLSEADQDAARSAAVVGAVIFSALFGVLWIVMAVFLGKGKNWARIVLTVLAALGVLGGLFGFGAERPLALTVVVVITLALEVALLFFLYQKDSSAYLKTH